MYIILTKVNQAWAISTEILTPCMMPHEEMNAELCNTFLLSMIIFALILITWLLLMFDYQVQIFQNKLLQSNWQWKYENLYCRKLMVSVTLRTTLVPILYLFYSSCWNFLKFKFLVQCQHALHKWKIGCSYFRK